LVLNQEAPRWGRESAKDVCYKREPMNCPCGSGQPLDACCAPFVRGDAVPDTAEALMRSRYTAYTQEAVDYIVATHDPATSGEVDRDATAQWAREATWTGLEIVDTVAGGRGDAEGVVEFVAKFELKGQALTHHERSEFKRIDGRWYYATGEMVRPKPVVRDKPKVGRNEACPCGSGKKYKRCCGAA
jgi:SEC-C motif-containing protein